MKIRPTCLAAENNATQDSALQRTPTKGSVHVSVTVDRGPTFGIGVSLLREGRIVRQAKTGYGGEYEFVDVEPGTYDVEFMYGYNEAGRERVEVVAGDHFVTVRADLHVSELPRVPECA